jgi:eukaryotic-like serine/threonine-protein kinase
VRANSPMGTARRLGTVLPPLRSRRRDLPEQLGATIDQALDPDPERRPPIRQLRAALDAADRELSNEGGLVEPGTLERLGLARERLAPEGMPLPSARTLALAGRFAAGAAAGGLAVAALEFPPDSTPPTAPLLVGTVVAIAVMLLPRLAWLATVVAAAVWFVLPENGLHGAALVLLAAAAVVPVLLPRSGLLWSVPALAPLLGAIGLAPLYVVFAGMARSAWRRAGLAAAGLLWLVIAEISTGSTFLFGAPDGSTHHHEWERSLNAAGDHALGPLVTTPALLPAAAWVALAVVLPFVVRGRSFTLDLLGVIVWTAGLIAAHQAIGRVLEEQDARGLAAGAVLAAVVAVGVPRMAGSR